MERKNSNKTKFKILKNIKTTEMICLPVCYGDGKSFYLGIYMHAYECSYFNLCVKEEFCSFFTYASICEVLRVQMSSFFFKSCSKIFCEFNKIKIEKIYQSQALVESLKNFFL